MEKWMKHPTTWNRLLLIVFILGSVWILLTRQTASADVNDTAISPKEGFLAPDFTLETLDGQTITLTKLRGQPVIVNFWATWCPPCQQEMPAIERVYQAYHSDGLEILAVNTTFQDSAADAAAFRDQIGLSFPILLDRAGSASADYQMQGLPSTYFIGRDGIIKAVVVGGPMSEALVRANVQQLLEEEN
ncbi:MAG: redoxin domain-containing protein [Anaerolineaceae bacterium]|nr:redoxin domain-containing protein [Anaerolineaceae bacterium]